MISDNLLSDKWFSSMVTTSSIIFFKLNLERTGQYVALIWCNQNNPTLDYRILPSPDFSYNSFYSGNPVISTNYCRYSSSGIYHIKLLVGYPDMSDSSFKIQSIAKVEILGSSIRTSTSTSTSTLTSTSKIIEKLTSSPRARYIKDEISKSGWVAIREMEVFDKNGQKIQIRNAQASCEWCNFGIPPFYAVGARGVFDGNWATVWNAGETNSNCIIRPDRSVTGICPSHAIRTAWIKIDLGEAYDIGKIKIHVMGESQNRIDKIYTSIDNENYTKICELKASPENPLVDRGPDGDWIECSL